MNIEKLAKFQELVDKIPIKVLKASRFDIYCGMDIEEGETVLKLLDGIIELKKTDETVKS